MKLLLGNPLEGHRIGQNVLTMPRWPNTSSRLVPLAVSRVCGREPKNGCLFDIWRDVTESHSLAQAKPLLFKQMLAEVDRLEKDGNMYSPDRGSRDPRACERALGPENKGYWGPWLPAVAASHDVQHAAMTKTDDMVRNRLKASDEIAADDAGDEPAWRLTFSEEFDTADNFTRRWTKSNNTIMNALDDDQTYFAENALVRDGMLVIETKPGKTTIAGRTTNFTSAWVTTQDYFAQAFGRFAIRARLPKGTAPGIFPALWLMPQPPAKCWPTAGEIDIMEYVQRPGCAHASCQVVGTLHWGDECGKGLCTRVPDGPCVGGGHGLWAQPGPKITDDFHIFSIDWTHDRLAWKVDGVEYWAQNSSTVEIPQTPFYFIINTARRPVPWEGFPWPVHFEIDWVRAWTPMHRRAALKADDETPEAAHGGKKKPATS
jgi:beta-glucanase (GH16 family)